MKRVKRCNKSMKQTGQKLDQTELTARKVCAVLSILFALSGFLVIITAWNISAGIFLILLSIVFMVLALQFRHVRIRIGLFEIDAQRN
jgi:membrane protein YdbS with pleckstrin-like domain